MDSFINFLQELAWTVSIASGWPFFAGMILIQVLSTLAVLVTIGLVLAFMRVPLNSAGGFIKWVVILTMYGVGFSIAVTPGGILILIVEIVAGVVLFAISRGYGFKSGYIRGSASVPGEIEINFDSGQTTFAPNSQLEVPLAAAQQNYFTALNADRVKHRLPLLTTQQFLDAHGNQFED